MDDKLLQIFRKTVKTFCLDNGLEASFASLLRILRENIPTATCILCHVIYRKNHKSMQIAKFDDTNLSFPKTMEYPAELNMNPRFFIKGDDPRIYMVDMDSADDNFVRNVSKTDTVHRSFMGIELDRNEERIFMMGLRSKELHAFTREHAALLYYLHAPMYDVIQGLFESAAPLNVQKIQTAAGKDGALSMLARCPGMAAAMRQVKAVAPTNANVLIRGDSGVGKELVAEALHNASKRRGRPLVKVNCGAIPESLLEAELFGYDKGAFTGAISAHKGYFEQADGGTLFLDEVGELSPMAQVRLLRVLESHELQRIGSPRRVLLDFRLIVATNRDLEAMVRAGSFRPDLWYRLNTYPLSIAPLNKRPEDIPVLVRYYCERCAVELGMEYQPKISREFLQDMMMRDWPGNIRQLRNFMERALIHTRMLGKTRLTAPPEEEGAEQLFSPGMLLSQEAEKRPLTLEEVNAKYIAWALNQCDGRIQGPRGAARLLGLNAATLRSRMVRLGMPFPARAKRETER